MDSVLARLQWLVCLVYIDDIIIMGKSFEEHLQTLQQMFERIKLSWPEITPWNLQQKVYFLGHIVLCRWNYTRSPENLQSEGLANSNYSTRDTTTFRVLVVLALYPKLC